MRPTEILKDEHKIIKKYLDVIDKIVESASRDKEVNPLDIENIVDFIRTFADKCHHGKEQDLLFPAMESSGIPREGGPIGVMLEEHEIGRNFVKNLASAILKYKNGDKKALKDIAENASGYSELLRQHIDKEDNILYMMADMHLDEDTQKKLLEDFDKVEREMGPDTHEKYHRLLEDLTKKYNLE